MEIIKLTKRHCEIIERYVALFAFQNTSAQGHGFYQRKIKLMFGAEMRHRQERVFILLLQRDHVDFDIQTVRARRMDTG